MKNLILHLKENWQVFIFALAGLFLVIFPAQVAGAAPYMIGLISILYAVVNTIISVKYPDAQIRLGDSVIHAVIGGIVLHMKADSISIIGVIWAVQSLQASAGEINEAYETRHLSLFSAVNIIGSIALAALLMMDPFEHFNMHVRILGLEMIFWTLIRKRRAIQSKRDH